jgi:hypothetical protein
MPCQACNLYVIDWFRAHSTGTNEFSGQLRMKSIIKNRDAIANELYRITLKLIDLTPEDCISSEEYDVQKILMFYNSGGRLANTNDLPKEVQFAILCFFRNELIKFIFDQDFATDLEYVLSFVTDLICHRDQIVISQWIADCLLKLHEVRLIHENHKHTYN